MSEEENNIMTEAIKKDPEGFHKRVSDKMDVSLQELLGGHGVWSPELERGLLEWINSQPREVICTKCGIREQKGEQPKADF